MIFNIENLNIEVLIWSYWGVLHIKNELYFNNCKDEIVYKDVESSSFELKGMESAF